MSDDPSAPLVTVARYDTRGNAHLAKSRLEEAGIRCMLANEDQAGLATFFDATEGGVQVKVPENRAEEAQSVLDQT